MTTRAADVQAEQDTEHYECAEGMGAIFWLMWFVAFLCAIAILFGAGLWYRHTESLWALVGLSGDIAILALLLRAAVGVGRGRG